MKPIILATLAALGVFLAFYLMIAFIKIEANPFEWTENLRGVFVMFGSLFAGLAFAITHTNTRGWH